MLQVDEIICINYVLDNLLIMTEQCFTSTYLLWYNLNAYATTQCPVGSSNLQGVVVEHLSKEYRLPRKQKINSKVVITMN